MEQEKTSVQKGPNYSLIEHFLNETNGGLPEELLRPLTEDIDNPKSFTLLVEYLKRDLKTRVPEIIRELNFDFGTNPKNFDTYEDYKKKIEELLEEKDGITDESKREQAQLLLKVVKSTKVSE